MSLSPWNPRSNHGGLPKGQGGVSAPIASAYSPYYVFWAVRRWIEFTVTPLSFPVPPLIEYGKGTSSRHKTIPFATWQHGRARRSLRNTAAFVGKEP